MKIEMLKKPFLTAFFCMICTLCISQSAKVSVFSKSWHLYEDEIGSRWGLFKDSINNSTVYFIDTAANTYYFCKVADNSITVPQLFLNKKCIIVLHHKHKYYASSYVQIDSLMVFQWNCWSFYIDDNSNELTRGLKDRFSIRLEGTVMECGYIQYQKRAKYHRYSRKLVRKAKRHGTLLGK